MPVWGRPPGKGRSVTSDRRGVVSCDDDCLRREDIEAGYVVSSLDLPTPV
jgi:hypothetical protein